MYADEEAIGCVSASVRGRDESIVCWHVVKTRKAKAKRKTCIAASKSLRPKTLSSSHLQTWRAVFSPVAQSVGKMGGQSVVVALSYLGGEARPSNNGIKDAS